MTPVRLLLLTAILLFVSCTTATSPELSATGPGGPVGYGSQVFKDFPQFPADRQTSSTLQTVQNGSDAYLHSDNASVDGTTLILESDENQPSWGVWRFGPVEDSLVSIEVQLTLPPGNEAYIGLADYSTMQWTFFGPYSSSQTLPLDDDKHKSPLGFTHVAVVTDGGNIATVNRLILETASGWQVVVVEQAGITNDPSPSSLVNFTSLLNVQGHPAILYGVWDSEAKQGQLKYVRAEDALGLTWGEPVIVATSPNVSYISATLLAEGQPCVYWLDYYYTGTPHFAYATDLVGASWSDPVTIEDSSGGEYGDFTYGTLRTGPGDPVACYFDFIDAELHFTRSDTESHVWNASDTISAEGATFPTCGFDVSGVPRLFYTDEANRDLWEVRRNAENTAWLSPQVIDEESWAGNHLGTAVVESEIAVAYNDLAGGTVKFARYNSIADEWAFSVADHAHSTCAFISMVITAGKPAIAYCDYVPGQLRYVRALDATGAAWGDPVLIDTDAYTGFDASMADINGLPGISYINVTTGSLKFAIQSGQ